MTTMSSTRPVQQDARKNFARHFLEMVAAMVVGMAVLGAAVSGLFAAFGHSDLLHFAALRAVLMTSYMTVGMSLWMRHRRHGWPAVAEMAAAMFVPLGVLIGPYAAGVLSKASLLGLTHVLMLPCMVAVMLRRREEYSQDHRLHERPIG